MSNQTVAEVLVSADDSITVINDINTNGSDSEYVIKGSTQDEINDIVQRNVDHLEIVLAYNGENNLPDIAGSSEDKSSYTTAIATGKTYIAAN